MKLMIINGSVREGRVSETIQKWAVEVLKQDSELELDIVDLKELGLPFYDEHVLPAMPNSFEQYKSPAGTAWAKRVAKAEAFIMITPEYNYGTSAVLKNAIDWVYHGWNHKPVGFISYGGISAGTRAIQQLRQNIVHVKLYSAVAAVNIPFVRNAFDETGTPTQESTNESLNTLVAELKDLQGRLAIQ